MYFPKTFTITAEWLISLMFIEMSLILKTTVIIQKTTVVWINAIQWWINQFALCFYYLYKFKWSLIVLVDNIKFHMQWMKRKITMIPNEGWGMGWRWKKRERIIKGRNVLEHENKKEEEHSLWVHKLLVIVYFTRIKHTYIYLLRLFVLQR